jgi:hypothetical protein
MNRVVTRIALALLGAASVAACSSDRALLAEAPASQPSTIAANTADPGANPPPAMPTTTAGGGPEVYNSDNRPTYARSGLNGDPNNPSGAPGRPWSWNSY